MALGLLVNFYHRRDDPSTRNILPSRKCVVSRACGYPAILTRRRCAAFAPILLERKANKIRKTMDVEQGTVREVRTIYDTADRHWRVIVTKALTRPFVLFVREPIIQLLGIYMAFIYGTMYRKRRIHVCRVVSY